MYTLTLERRAHADLRRLDPQIRARARQQLDKLREDCDDRDHKALTGKHKGKFRLRFANHYRILYDFDKRANEIYVYRIGHRSKVY